MLDFMFHRCSLAKILFPTFCMKSSHNVHFLVEEVQFTSSVKTTNDNTTKYIKGIIDNRTIQ